MARDAHAEVRRRGSSHKSRGHVSGIREGEKGHDEVTIKHPHLSKSKTKGGARDPFDYAPQSTLQLPTGHGLQVGDSVKLHVSPDGE